MSCTMFKFEITRFKVFQNAINYINNICHQFLKSYHAVIYKYTDQGLKQKPVQKDKLNC